MTQKKILVGRSDYDDQTSYIYAFAGEVLKSLPSEIKLDLKKERFTKENTSKMIARFSPKFLFFNGHGAPDRIFGHKDEEVIILGENDDLLSNRIIYSVACDSAAELGKNAKSKAYIGYEGSFAIVIDASESCTPLKSKFIRAFLEPSNEVPKAIISGKTAGDAYSKSQEAFDKSISFFESTTAPINSEHVLPWLVWDKTVQVLHGNPKAKM